MTVLNPQSSNLPTNKAQGFEANYVFAHESQAVLAVETHSQSASSKHCSPGEGPRRSVPVSCLLSSLNSQVGNRCPAASPPRKGLDRVAAVTEDSLCCRGEEGVIKAALWVFNWHLSWLPSGTGQRVLLC